MEVLLGGAAKVDEAVEKGELVKRNIDGVDFYFDRTISIETHRGSEKNYKLRSSQAISDDEFKSLNNVLNNLELNWRSPTLAYIYSYVYMCIVCFFGLPHVFVYKYTRACIHILVHLYGHIHTCPYALAPACVMVRPCARRAQSPPHNYCAVSPSCQRYTYYVDSPRTIQNKTCRRQALKTPYECFTHYTHDRKTAI